MQMAAEHQRQLRQAIVFSGRMAPFTLVHTQKRGFTKPSKKDGSKKREQDKEDSEKDEDSEHLQKKQRVEQNQEQQNQDQQDEDSEQRAEFKTHRRIIFLIRKGLKYTIWMVSAAFLYHFYLVTNKEKPEEGFGAAEPLLTYAYVAKDFYQFIRDLLTKPPVNSLLMERPPTPPGY